MQQLSTIRYCRAVLALTLLAWVGPSHASEHPQDGAHADLRVYIEDGEVRLAAGLNLAFTDEIIPPAREAMDTLSPPEADRLRARLRRFYNEDVVLRIDGIEVEPEVVRLDVLADPDPALLALFPRTGARALIRFAAAIRYPAKTPPESVEFVWPAYPPNTLIEEQGPPPPMVIDVLFESAGPVEIMRVSQADPSALWLRSGHVVTFDEVPELDLGPGPSAEGSAGWAGRVLTLGLGVLSLALFLRVPDDGARSVLLAGGVFGGAIALTGMGFANPPKQQAQTITPQAVESVFRPLHANLYRAFDYADPAQCYDALERSVSGDLLEDIYAQVRRSLFQAEQDGLTGNITGVEPGRFEYLGAEPAQDGTRLLVEYEWSVDGTVYHYGHSHTRTNAYRAQYTLAQNTGSWKIVAQTILDQRRTDDGTGIPLLQQDAPDPTRDGPTTPVPPPGVPFGEI